MSMRRAVSRSSRCFRAGLSFLAAFNFIILGPLATALQAATTISTGPVSKKNVIQINPSLDTRTPIKHAIVIIGENRTFDHIFATYKPKAGESVDNLLSRGIVNPDGSPGPNYSFAIQYTACDGGTGTTCPPPLGVYQTSPQSKSLYPRLPAPLTGGPSNVCTDNGICTLADATSSENGLSPAYYQFMLTGGTGQTGKTPDKRITNVSNLPPGPFQLTSKTFPYDAYAASPVHRFYQMWQQLDCNTDYGIFLNPAGCAADLVAWVEVTVGAGTNGKPQPANFSTNFAVGKVTTGEGSTAMGFYNMQQGDAPYLKFLADNYSMSDNFHQSVMGGTGANHVMLGSGDAIFFSDANGNPAAPPHNQLVFAGTPNAGVVDEIENPNPQPKTNNWYTEDGYGGGAFGSPSFGGGSYTECADPAQPGVAPIRGYLSSLQNPINPRCQSGHYYLLNNYNPGYFGDGSNAYTDHNPANTPFTIPPSRLPTIGNSLLAKGISWKYYGDQFNEYLKDKYQINFGKVGPLSDQYCNICNPFQYNTAIMTNAAIRTAHIQDTTNLYSDIKNGTLPAVSFVKPSGWVDGHPASSKLNLFEGFVKKIVDAVQANPSLWQTTAIFVTFDEGGGYYDSGYVQPLDYFGDGTRIPMIVVSPYSRGGHVSHTYGDHVSILKFIEYNWGLNPVSARSRDNFPIPLTAPGNAYVPTNSPSLGDLTDLFDFFD